MTRLQACMSLLHLPSVSTREERACRKFKEDVSYDIIDVIEKTPACKGNAFETMSRRQLVLHYLLLRNMGGKKNKKKIFFWVLLLLYPNLRDVSELSSSREGGPPLLLQTLVTDSDDMPSSWTRTSDSTRKGLFPLEDITICIPKISSTILCSM